MKYEGYVTIREEIMDSMHHGFYFCLEGNLKAYLPQRTTSGSDFIKRLVIALSRHV